MRHRGRKENDSFVSMSKKYLVGGFVIIFGVYRTPKITKDPKALRLAESHDKIYFCGSLSVFYIIRKRNNTLFRESYQTFLTRKIDPLSKPMRQLVLYA